MKDADFYPIIFRRKSIRTYDPTPLDEDILGNIKDQITSLKPLYNDIEVDFKIISQSDVNSRMMKKAPHYIAAFSEAKEKHTEEGYKTNIGFILQQMDLFFSANGLGSCWQGIPKPRKKVLESSDLEFIILMAFGNPKETLHRNNILEFKRKPLQKICKISDSGVDEILEAARLAPSAINSQPWFFTRNNHVINVHSFKPNIIRAIIMKKYIPIDMGIALYHLKVGAEHFGKTVEIVFDENAKNNTPNGYNYVISLKMD
ncbi:nitroreductase family protein [Methanobacterium petrolearium]|uniref:nitroreductase family protein n=1 Tax=Methanobacterium petrolearium TaxID=710190 RepID=UPI001AE926F4|nr:nitroreductase family protein [Methanobacterium petrolearium]MBP1946423.1 nitroreductase [Methanobacterium petrolearium]BDZ70550.1 nitroreductase [Methanobacterium petrolearium]